MSFAKVFTISLVSIMVLNFIVLTITYAIAFGFDSLIGSITADPIFILFMLFGSIGKSIWLTINGLIISLDPFWLDLFITNIGSILAPLIAAVIIGRFSDKRVWSLAGFFLASMIGMIICIVLVYYSFTYQIAIGGSIIVENAVVSTIIGSIINGLIYGFIAYLATKK